MNRLLLNRLSLYCVAVPVVALQTVVVPAAPAAAELAVATPMARLHVTVLTDGRLKVGG